MSQARRNRRVLAVMSACAVLLAAGPGCRHSPFHRVADAPRPDSVADLERAAIPELAPVVATKAGPPEAAPVSPEVEADPAGDPEAVAALAPAPTPMLDAALRRAEAEEEAERRFLQEALAPRREPDPEPQPEIATPPTAPPPSRPEPLEPEVIAPALVAEAPAPAPAPEPAAEPAPAAPAPKDVEPAEEPKVDPAVEPAAVEVRPTVDAQAAALKDAQLDRIDALEPQVDPAPVPEPTPAPSPDPAPLPIPPQPLPPSSTASETDLDPEEFAIQAARLCRKIHGFGSFEPMNANALKPGRSALVYCELGGLGYRAEGEEFVSHVATRVELVRDEDDAKVWEVSGEAEDRCRAKRRDSYVGTLITLPESLAPGDYTLRLSQTDATSGRTAAAEIPVTIAR
jgi:hypothetical protein